MAEWCYDLRSILFRSNFSSASFCPQPGGIGFAFPLTKRGLSNDCVENKTLARRDDHGGKKPFDSSRSFHGP